MRADTSSHYFRIWSPVVARFLCGLEQDGHPGLFSSPLGFSFLHLTRWAAHCLSASYRLVLPQCSSYLWAFSLLEKKRKEGGKKISSWAEGKWRGDPWHKRVMSQLPGPISAWPLAGALWTFSRAALKTWICVRFSPCIFPMFSQNAASVYLCIWMVNLYFKNSEVSPLHLPS